MNYFFAILLLAGTISKKSCHTGTPYSANVYDIRDSSFVYFANVLFEDFKGHEIVQVTTGDEGRIFIPSLSKEFVVIIDHPSYLQKIDTIDQKSIRKNAAIWLSPKE